MLDLDKLGWKEEKNSYGETSVECNLILTETGVIGEYVQPMENGRAWLKDQMRRKMWEEFYGELHRPLIDLTIALQQLGCYRGDFHGPYDDLKPHLDKLATLIEYPKVKK